MRDWIRNIPESSAGISNFLKCRMITGVGVLAGQVDHAGVPEMGVQPEVDDLCAIANTLNIPTPEVEAAVLKHYGNHHKAMEVQHSLVTACLTRSSCCDWAFVVCRCELALYRCTEALWL